MNQSQIYLWMDLKIYMHYTSKYACTRVTQQAADYAAVMLYMYNRSSILKHGVCHTHAYTPKKHTIRRTSGVDNTTTSKKKNRGVHHSVVVLFAKQKRTNHKKNTHTQKPLLLCLCLLLPSPVLRSSEQGMSAVRPHEAEGWLAGWLASGDSSFPSASSGACLPRQHAREREQASEASNNVVVVAVCCGVLLLCAAPVLQPQRQTTSEQSKCKSLQAGSSKQRESRHKNLRCLSYNVYQHNLMVTSPVPRLQHARRSTLGRYDAHSERQRDLLCCAAAP